MARSTEDRRLEVREERERSPGRGIGRPATARGGRWDITEEPIRTRRTKEGREKRRDPATLARAARKAADEMRARETADLPMGGKELPRLFALRRGKGSRALKLGESGHN